MKKSKLAISLLCASVVFVTLLGGCKKDNGITNAGYEGMQTPSSMELTNAEGKVRSDLTGEWVDKEIAVNRPVAIMINNIGEAMPQSGIGNADIIYEMTVEGGITRLMAVFSDYQTLPKIGPVRSARQYYVRQANSLDALFCHIGTSTLADNEIDALGVDNMDGMTSVGNYFIYRDTSRVAPHNAYTSGEGLMAAITNTDKNMAHKDNYTKPFSFYTKNKAIENGKSASKVITAFNTNRIPYFVYNEEEKLYYRFQYGDKHIDDQTGDQLAFQNIIIQFAETYSVDGYLMEIENGKGNSGDGYYITDGQYIAITWKNENGTLQYYDMNGEILKLNPGKTWITYFDANNVSGVTFE